MVEDLVYRLRKRSEIRRQIKDRKSVREGKPDNIANILDEAADEIERMRIPSMNQLDNIEIITCPLGDWTILKVNGKEFDSGHSIDWIDLLRFFGHDVKVTEISDEEMEELM